jgi:hypothetical protein
VRQRRLAPLRPRPPETDAAEEELTLGVDERHQHDRSVEQLRGHSRDAVELVRGPRIEQVRRVQGGQTP